ncbi:MAG TPA: glycoside hydrolase family 76 protein [Solirubrobacteraceae bacterium]
MPTRAHKRQLPRRAVTRARCCLAVSAILAVGALQIGVGSSALAAPLPVLAPAQQHYLALAQEGVARAQSRWRDTRRGWYDARLGDRDRYPLATIWDIVPLFESLDAIAIASPTSQNRRAVERFAAGAERYLNRGLRPLPGYSPYPGDREASTETWFDDNGWWGLAFVNAYRATGRQRYLADAQRALHYIATVGWDAVAGGIWWNTGHPYKAGEALASATLLATLLYQQTRSPFALAQARRFLAWANSSGFSAADRLYAASDISATPIDYIEAPLIYAQAVLCRLQGVPGECERAVRLKATAVQRFGQALDFSPQYDAIYLQWMLALSSLEGDSGLYALAAANARHVQSSARDGQGLFLRSWGGGSIPTRYARPGMLQTQAATSSLFAWLAVYPPP